MTLRFPHQVPVDLNSFRVPEYDAVRVALGDCRGLTVLDAGCGSAEFADLLNSAAKIVAMDRCVKPLQRRRTRSAPGEVLRADVTQMPFPANSFDVVICTSVISQLPSPELRDTMLAELSRVLRPGGRLIITAMHYNFRFRRKAFPQEGYEGGQFYRKFDLDEFRDGLGAHFDVAALWGLWNYLPKTYRLYLGLGNYVVYWERFIRTRKTSLRYGKSLLAVCQKRA